MHNGKNCVQAKLDQINIRERTYNSPVCRRSMTALLGKDPLYHQNQPTKLDFVFREHQLHALPHRRRVSRTHHQIHCDPTQIALHRHQTPRSGLFSTCRTRSGLNRTSRLLLSCDCCEFSQSAGLSIPSCSPGTSAHEDDPRHLSMKKMKRKRKWKIHGTERTMAVGWLEEDEDPGTQMWSSNGSC